MIDTTEDATRDDAALGIDEARALDEARQGFYRFLASIYKYELSPDQIERMAHQHYPTDDPYLGTGYARIAEYLRHRDSGTRQELAVDYARVFLNAGQYTKTMAPPFESVFTSADRLLMQDARDGVLGHYRAEGLDLPSDNTIPEDHLSFELEFMAELIGRAVVARDAGDDTRYDDLCEKQRAFFDQHLMNWVPSFCDDVEKMAETDFYRGIAQITRGFIVMEDEMIGAIAPVV